MNAFKVFKHGYRFVSRIFKKNFVLPVLLSLIFSSFIQAGETRDLLNACYLGDLSTLSAWVEQQNARSRYVNFSAMGPYEGCSTPVSCLMIAASQGNLEVVDYLVPKVNIAQRTLKSETVLHFAASSGKIEVVKKLVENFADVNLKSVDGNTPLHLAISSKTENAEDVALYMLEQHADVFLRNIAGETPLHLAAGQGFQRLVEKLLEMGVNPNIENINGSMALHYAAYGGSLEIVKLLLARPVNVNKGNCFGTTPLIMASAMGHLEVVRELMDAKADPAKVGFPGTAILAAAVNNRGDVIRLLAAKGANVNVSGKGAFQPIHVAAESDNLDAVKALLESSAKVDGGYQTFTPLYFASKEGNAEVISYLLQKGASPESAHSTIPTALQWAAYRHKPEAIKVLCNGGADVNRRLFRRKQTPLFIAANEGETEITDVLLQKKADPRIKAVINPFFHCSPMEVAIFKGHKETLAHLAKDPRSREAVGVLGRMAALMRGFHLSPPEEHAGESYNWRNYRNSPVQRAPDDELLPMVVPTISSPKGVIYKPTDV